MKLEKLDNTDLSQSKTNDPKSDLKQAYQTTALIAAAIAIAASNLPDEAIWE